MSRDKLMELWPISQDRHTQNQVAGILILRELRRMANGEPTELERRDARSRNTPDSQRGE